MAIQFLIIDGYNVLHTCGLIRGEKLADARARLLEILRRNIDETNRKRATVVFDSSLPQETRCETIAEVLVEFASDHHSADERIAQLIRQHSASKQLTVVSSDHEIQRVARSRGARVVDSEEWLESLQNRSASESGGNAATDPSLAKPNVKLSAEEIREWSSLMGANEAVPGEENATPSATDSSPETPGLPDEIFSDQLVEELNRLFEKDRED